MATPQETAAAFREALDHLAAAPLAAGDLPVEPRVQARIRENVIDVLRRMHGIYHAAAWEGRGRPELLGLDASLPPGERVAAAFERFCGVLRASWEKEVAEEDLFGRAEEAAKGRVKLAALGDAREAWSALRTRDGGAP